MSNKPEKKLPHIVMIIVAAVLWILIGISIVGCRQQSAEDQLLQRVNQEVNQDVIAAADTRFGVSDLWRYPTDGKGDCEDYALEKARRLRTAGIDPARMKIVVLIRSNDEPHAILSIDDNKYLDNLSPWIEKEVRGTELGSITITNNLREMQDEALFFIVTYRVLHLPK